MIDFFNDIDHIILDNNINNLFTLKGGKIMINKKKQNKEQNKEQKSDKPEIKRKELKETIIVNEEVDFQSETIMWDKLSREELFQVLDNILLHTYTRKWERLHLINRLLDLYYISQKEISNIKENLLKGIFNVNWIIPITDDIKLVFNKLEEEGSVIIKLNDFEQQITDYRKSITGQNDIDTLILAFSGYKNNLDTLKGINLPCRNNRLGYSYNSQEYRIIHQDEIIKLIGLKINLNDLYKINNLNNDYPQLSTKPRIKFNFKTDFNDEYFFNNYDEYKSTLTIIEEIYNAYTVVKMNAQIELHNKLLNLQVIKKEEDKTKAYKYQNDNLGKELINNKMIKQLYTNYYSHEYSAEQINSWGHLQRDNASLYYLLKSFLEDNKDFNQKAGELAGLLKLKLDDNDKEKVYKELVENNVEELLGYINLNNYTENIRKSENKNRNELSKLFWVIITIIGEARFNELLNESKIKNVGVSSLLTKKEKETIELFVKEYDEKIKSKQIYCEFDDLRNAFDNTPFYETDKKSKLLQKLLDKYAPRDKDNQIILPATRKMRGGKAEETEQLIYWEDGPAECRKFDICCNHEIIMFINIPNVKDPEEARNLNTLLQQKYEIPNEDQTEFICKYCQRYMRLNLGENDTIEYDNDNAVIKTGVNTKTEMSVLTKMNEYINFIGRGDINGRELAEDIMPFINENIVKEMNTKNFELKKDIIQISFIIAILSNTLIHHVNKYVNTSMFPLVNYNINELIKYFESITEKLFGNIYEKIRSYKLDFFRIVLNRYNTLYSNASFIAERKKNKLILDTRFDYTKNIENFAKNDTFENMIKNGKTVNYQELYSIIFYLCNKYFNLYQNDFYKKKYLDVDTIQLLPENLEKVNQLYHNDINITGIKNKEVISKIKEIGEIIKKLSSEIKNRLKKNMDIVKGRKPIIPVLDEKYVSEIDERRNIIEFFIQRGLDGTTQEYTYQGYSLIDGRNINDITNPSEKEYKEMEKIYYDLKKNEKKEAKSLYEYQYKPLKIDEKYKKLTDINDKNIKLLVEKILLKSLNFDEVMSSNSSADEISGEEEGLNKFNLTNFLMNFGYFINSRTEDISRIIDPVKKEKREKEYEKKRKETIRSNLVDLIILIEILKNKMNSINIKNMKGLEKYEKYVIFEEFFKKIKLDYSIDDINNIARSTDITDKKKGNILLNILVDTIIDNSGIHQKINNFFTEFIIFIKGTYNYLDVSQTERNNNYQKNEDDIFNTVKKINNITDEDRIELGISFIDLRKVNDPYEFVDVIKKVDDYKLRSEINNEQLYDGENGFDDEEFEMGQEFEL